jgi:hypothetical protein
MFKSSKRNNKYLTEARKMSVEKNGTIETPNLIIKLNKESDEWECYRKHGTRTFFLKSCRFQTALIIGMKAAANNKYRQEIDEALK